MVSINVKNESLGRSDRENSKNSKLGDGHDLENQIIGIVRPLLWKHNIFMVLSDAIDNEIENENYIDILMEMVETTERLDDARFLTNWKYLKVLQTFLGQINRLVDNLEGSDKLQELFSVSVELARDIGASKMPKEFVASSIDSLNKSIRSNRNQDISENKNFH